MPASKQWERVLELPSGASAKEVCRAFPRLASALVPYDLGAMPVHTLAVSALPSQFARASAGRLAWTAPSAYSLGQRHLPRGHKVGPVVFLNDLATKTTAERCDILLHELAHVVDYVVSGEFAEEFDMHSPATAEVQLRGMSPRTATPSNTMTDADRARHQAWLAEKSVKAHQLAFTRILIHLDYRVRTLGIVPTGLHAGGERYRMKDYDTCFNALGDEVYRRTTWSFADILASPMPPAFVACCLDSRPMTAAPQDLDHYHHPSLMRARDALNEMRTLCHQ